jgi:hypothetical protein
MGRGAKQASAVTWTFEKKKIKSKQEGIILNINIATFKIIFKRGASCMSP